MSETTAGARALSPNPCELGEGATYHAASDTAWWFDILGRTLFEHRFATGETRTHPLPFMGSQLSFAADGRQVVAADTGLYARDPASGETRLIATLESENAGTRSNDGRPHPSGALWIGTMGRQAETGAGSIYWFRGGEVRRLFPNVSIPNAICFSPDGTAGYFVDTAIGHLMRVTVDPATGMPAGAPNLFYDATRETADDAGLDGAVTDAAGTVWVARWGGARVSAISPDGRLLRSLAVPARQASCPTFVGRNLDRMIVTTAFEGMDAAARAADPQAGLTFRLDAPVHGRLDPPIAL